MHDDLARYAAVAQRSVAEAGKMARASFGLDVISEIKGPRGDLVTSVDRACERLIVQILHDAFPHHAIQGEESGRHFGDSEWVWLVDPLDGTNNYANGLPLYGSAVTLCHRGEPQVAAIGEAHTDNIACAIKGSGVLVNGKPFHRDCGVGSRAPATALWIGYESQYDGRLSAITSTLYAQSRRLFSTWAPTVDVFLYLRGALDAIVVYQCSGMELLGSLLVVKEAGGEVRSADGPAIPCLAALPELSFAGDDAAVIPLIRLCAPAEAR
jgi:myo-inositol-1(or 4)-monophosphatase